MGMEKIGPASIVLKSPVTLEDEGKSVSLGERALAHIVP